MDDVIKFNSNLTAREFAMLGNGVVAYIRTLSRDKAMEILGPVPDMPSDIKLFGLFSADGTPLAISDNHETALASAFENDLNPASVH